MVDMEEQEAADAECLEATTQLHHYQGQGREQEEGVVSEGEPLVPDQARDYFDMWSSGLMDDATVATRWGWTMAARFVRAMKVKQPTSSAEDMEGRPGPVQMAAMRETLQVWKQELFPDGGEGIDESDIIQDAPFPAGELGYNLARFEARHAGYITQQSVLKAGGLGLLNGSASWRS